jgi:hypothetical protein
MFSNQTVTIWLRYTYLPYEFATIDGAVDFIRQNSMGITHGITRIEKDTEHLTIRCPVSGEYLDITSSEKTLNELDKELSKQHLYKTI